MIKRFILLHIVLAAIFQSYSGCLFAQTKSAYFTNISNWHQQRVAYLKSPTGWLNIEGLFWLRPGNNSFGSAPGNDIVFEHPDMPANAGAFILSGKQVLWQSNAGTSVMVDGLNLEKAIIYNSESAKNPAVRLGPFSWNIIKREEKIGVRFRNLNSPAVNNFTGIDRFTVDSSWKLTALLVPSEKGGVVITNVLGQTNLEKSPGQLRFSINGRIYTLEALDEGGDELFIIFGDATNGSTTYPSGRFIYVMKPGANGQTEIDFNKAINPPCAFTDFATCPIPPRQNVLPLAITAGEKNFELHPK
ncbi:DUF1684 domain-containing protein [Flavihumibacter fluvii]|uniref:DUF1684 domain-containing protein n=1 Tax=Flavihumibacter fluvii TaxID=2838157 RepID=UPI001BDF25A9|nr:DUF1684 domain-containing protein [Flavihumibacter fluvii]ULQ52655.1 DUF1684 domain-containing protein [Flavihumibacter fluvii]